MGAKQVLVILLVLGFAPDIDAKCAPEYSDPEKEWLWPRDGAQNVPRDAWVVSRTHPCEAPLPVLLDGRAWTLPPVSRSAPGRAGAGWLGVGACAWRLPTLPPNTRHELKLREGGTSPYRPEVDLPARHFVTSNAGWTPSETPTSTHVEVWNAYDREIAPLRLELGTYAAATTGWTRGGEVCRPSCECVVPAGEATVRVDAAVDIAFVESYEIMVAPGSPPDAPARWQLARHVVVEASCQTAELPVTIRNPWSKNLEMSCLISRALDAGGRLRDADVQCWPSSDPLLLWDLLERVAAGRVEPWPSPHATW